MRRTTAELGTPTILVNNAGGVFPAALELASYGIRVNAIAPDITLTEGLAALNSDAATTDMGNIVPLGRPGQSTK